MSLRHWLSGLLFTVLFSLQSFAGPVHLVFDLDWTIFYSINAEDPLQMDKKVIQVEGKYYRATDHFEEMLRTLIKKYPEMKISFFSGGVKSRNIELLKSLKIDEKRTALDIATHVFNADDLTVLSTDKTLPFAVRNKKQIEKLIPDFDVKNTILIDDKPEFASKGVVAVSSLGTTTFTTAFTPERAHLKYYPESFEEWRLERNKADLWLERIEEALRHPQGLSFAEAAKKSWISIKEKLQIRLRCSKIYLEI